MKKYLPFGSIWLTNTVLFYTVPLIFPQYYELGSYIVPEVIAAIVSGLLLTLFCWAAKPIVSSLKIKLKGNYTMFLFYFVSNFVGVWIIARFAPYTGFGLVSYYWAATLALAMNTVQWLMWQILKKDKLV
jgi:uncharacterized membrane protein YvlD (DUF360 family)